MYYPLGFPPEAQNRVEAAKIRAGWRFDRDRQKAPPASVIRLSLVNYIMRVFGVFVRQAKLGRSWRASDMKSACLEFLRQLTIEAYFEKGYDHVGRPLSPLTSRLDGSILPEVLQAFRTWSAWRYFEHAQLTVATFPGRPRPAAVPEQPPEQPTPASPAEPTGDKAVTEPESVIKAAQPVDPAQKAGPLPAAKGRSADVKNFIARMKDAGYTIRRVDITIVAGRHKDPRSLQHFQYDIAKASPAAIEDYSRVLRMAPADFMAILPQRRTEIEASRKPTRKARR